MKCRAAIDCGFGPDTSAVAMNNSLYDRQANAGAFKFVCAMQSLEYAEELVLILHVKTRPVVADEIDLLAFLLPRANLDNCRFPLSRIFNRVRKQIDPDLFQQRRVAFARRQIADAQINLAPAPLPI